MKYKTIFWDWNGTLIDDVDLAMAASNSILSKRNKIKITKEQYYEYIDIPIMRFYERIIDFSEISFEEIMVEFNAYYTQNLSSYPLMQGAKEVLSELAGNGMTQIVLSSSSNEMLLPFMEKFGVRQYFAHVLGASDNYCNGKTERALKFIRENQMKADDCVLIGDMIHDFDTASAIGCDCILIPNGHQSKRDLAATGARIADDIKLIPDIIYSNGHIH